MTTTCVDVNVRDSAVHEDNKRHSSVRPFLCSLRFGGSGSGRCLSCCENFLVSLRHRSDAIMQQWRRQRFRYLVISI
eukprot:scaffold529_cov196-Alexandrium_tamarense.AAC.18